MSDDILNGNIPSDMPAPSPEAPREPLRSDGFDAQQRELSEVKFFDWFNERLYPSMLQAIAVFAVVGAGPLAPAVGITPAVATLIAGGAMLAFELGRAYFRNRANLNRELALYHNDIARVLDKPLDSKLTVPDMYKAADEKVVGDKALKPLQMELKHLAYRNKYNYVMAIARAAVTTLTAIAMSSAVGFVQKIGDIPKMGFSAYMSLTGALSVIGMATISIEKMGKSYFRSHEPLSVYPDLVKLQDMAKQQTVQPEQVFPIILKLDKNLSEYIKSHLGKPYEELTQRNKTRVIKACESKAHAIALADAINEGQLPVTAIAFSGMGQKNWRNNLSHEKETSQDAQAKTLEKSFVATLAGERATSYLAQAVQQR